MKQILNLRSFVAPYWKLSLLSLFLLTVVVILDLAIPRLVQQIVDQGIARQDMDVVLQTTVLMLGISVVNTLFSIGNNIFSVRVGESVARDLREALFLKIQSYSYGNLDRINTGQLMVRLSSDTNVFQRLVQVSLRIGTRAPMLMIGSLILMFRTDARLALAIIPVLLATSLVIAFFVLKMGPLYAAVQQKLDRLNTVLQENIAGVRVVKAFERSGYESGRFEAANQDYTDNSTRVLEFMASMSPALNVLINLGVVVVIWAGGLQAIEGRLTVGQIMAFTNYLWTTMGPLTIMAMLANLVAAGTASSRRIHEIMDTVPEVLPPVSPRSLHKTGQLEIVFEQVSFCYQNDDNGHRNILEEISLVAFRGETVAILGATGAGKSTLVNLIPRFYDVSAGRILINGVDVRQLDPEELLSWVGIVPQETVLFAGSVRDNILFGYPDASQEQVEAVARAAQAHEFILRLPEGYNTRVEARGVNLSGGQKQRIAIARALLKHPPILILDDSTSAVDIETETQIHDALDTWLHNSICFIVAQRVSTVLKADKIAVIDRGRIAALGNHMQLLQSSPIYQEIFASQLGNGLNPVGA